MDSGDSYELFILLNNDFTVTLPFLNTGSLYFTNQFHSSQIPTTLSFSVSDGTLKLGTEEHPEKNQDQVLGGFVDAFFRFSEDDKLAEVTKVVKKSTCRVSLNDAGNIRYHVSIMDEQTISPELALQLFIKYLINYESAWRRVLFKRIILAYPAWCNLSHHRNLTDLLHELRDFSIVCVNQIPCFISSLGNLSFISQGRGRHVILMYASYNVLHIFPCSVADNGIVVQRHLQSTSLSHKAIANMLFSKICEHFKVETSLDLPTTHTESVFQACNQALNKLLVQSQTVVQFSVNRRFYTYLIQDSLIKSFSGFLYSTLANDIRSMVDTLQWNGYDICSIIITGESAYLPTYRQWVQQLREDYFQSAMASASWSLDDILKSNVKPLIPMKWQFIEKEEERMILTEMKDVSPSVGSQPQTAEVAVDGDTAQDPHHESESDSEPILFSYSPESLKPPIMVNLSRE